MYHIYVDLEFDAVLENNKYYQAIVSFGAVLCNEKYQIIDTFYAYVKPKQFKRLTRIVKKMTALQDQQILNALSFPQVEKEFENWYQQKTNHDMVQLYSYGPDDRRTLIAESKRWEIEIADMFDHMIDVQKIISHSIYYEKELVSTTLSLDDIKSLYHIYGEVEHNAKEDALDLMRVHQAYVQHKKIAKIDLAHFVEKKKLKEKENLEKQLLQKNNYLKKKANILENETLEITFTKVFIQLCREWNQNDLQLGPLFLKEGIFWNDKVYGYEDSKLSLQVSFDTLKSYLHIQLYAPTFIGMKQILLRKDNLSYILDIAMQLQQYERLKENK